MTRTNRWPLALACLALGLIGGLVASEKLIGQQGVPVLPGNAPVLPREWNSYGPVVKRVLPAVVSIEGKGKAKPNLDDPDPGFGSGFIVDAAGVVVTNNHVVAETTTVDVLLLDGRKFTSTDIRRDPKSDVAVIRLDAKELLPVLEFGDSDAMEVGDRVLAVGAPFGLTGSVTHGIVSGKSRNNLHLNLFEDFIQIDAAVNPGNSGGPLVNMEGKVVGLTSAIKTRTGGFQGVGLAVSSKLAKVVSEQLAQHGAVRRPYLGVAVRDLDDATAAKLKLKPGAGVVITEVVAKSPGAKANLGVGDVITALNGTALATPRELHRATLILPVGKEAEVIVTRNGQPFQTKVMVEEQPDTLGPAPRVVQRPVNFDAVGIAVSALSADAASRAGLPKGTAGVVVTAVAKNGFAEQSGLTRGAVILQVDKTPVATADAFRQAIERASRTRGAVLQVLRANGDVDFVILKVQ